MEQFVWRTGQKLRDWSLALRYAAFPEDRPSPLFPLFGAVVNAIPLVWGCSMIPTAACEHRYKAWAALGIFHSFLNMVFGVVIVYVIRSQIKAGIRARTTTHKLFLQNIYLDMFLAYMCFEIIWMIVALVRGCESVDDTCRRHLLAQFSFLLVYMVVGGALFVLTFVTEWGSLPRWRAYAALRHHQQAYPGDLGGYSRSSFDADASGSALGEMSDTAHGSTTGRVRRQRRHSRSAPASAAPTRDARTAAEPAGSGQEGDDATSGDDYSEYADDEEEVRARRQVRFADPPHQSSHAR